MGRIGQLIGSAPIWHEGPVRRPIALFGLLALLAIAFATGSFARPAPSADEARLQAFMLWSGTPGDLCGDGEAEHPHLALCSLCHLVTMTNLPASHPPLVDIEQRLVASVILPRILRAAAHPRDPATPPRGPPHLT